jgi:hypothetical protein
MTSIHAYYDYLISDDITLTHHVTLPSGLQGFCNIEDTKKHGKNTLVSVYIWDDCLPKLMETLSLSDFQISQTQVFKESNTSKPREFCQHVHEILLTKIWKKNHSLSYKTIGQWLATLSLGR